MNILFEGKVALVTGAGSGMGLATAKAFAEEKAAVVLADVQEKAILAAAEELVAAGHRALAIPCDVSDDVQVEAMVRRTVAEFGRLDALDDDVGRSLAADVVQCVLHAPFAEGHEGDHRGSADDDAQHAQHGPQFVQPQTAHGQ